MNRVKIPWLNLMAGALFGGLLCLGSYFIDESVDRFRNLENLIFYLASIPALLSFKLGFSRLMLALSVIFYWGLMGLSPLLLWRSKSRYTALVFLIILLIILHAYGIFLINRECQWLNDLTGGLKDRGSYSLF